LPLLIETGERLGRLDSDGLQNIPTDYVDNESEAADIGATAIQSSNREPCRREIIWRPLNFNDFSLSNIAENYGDMLNLQSPSGGQEYSVPRRLGTRKTAAPHQCQEYLREEITFTPDAFRNAIVLFEKPTVDEICVLCGEVVRSGQAGRVSVVMNTTLDRGTRITCSRFPSSMTLKTPGVVPGDIFSPIPKPFYSSVPYNGVDFYSLEPKFDGSEAASRGWFGSDLSMGDTSSFDRALRYPGSTYIPIPCS
jgi:hypothetical protein